MDLREMEWIHLAHVIDQWQAVVKTTNSCDDNNETLGSISVSKALPACKADKLTAIYKPIA
jgi:hypothetical protein